MMAMTTMVTIITMTMNVHVVAVVVASLHCHRNLFFRTFNVGINFPPSCILKMQVLKIYLWGHFEFIKCQLVFCIQSSVSLNNKTGYIRFYIIVSVFPRTIILIYLHTSPDFRYGYIIHWPFAVCLCNICNCLCLFVHCISIFISFHV